MVPTPKELDIVPGDRVRVKLGFLPESHNPREVFEVTESPAHGQGGAVVLQGKLTRHRLNITADTDALKHKVSE